MSVVELSYLASSESAYSATARYAALLASERDSRDRNNRLADWHEARANQARAMIDRDAEESSASRRLGT